jgi:hypothetical protein
MSADRGENKDRFALNVFVNGRHFLMVKGMTVRHALLAAGVLLKDKEIPAVLDEWGNITSPEGSLTDGMKLFTSKQS